MISCTEFIAAYSELFAYIDETHGKEEVRRFWDYLFEPDGKGIPLINFVKEEGIRGCYSYWKGTLNEEAADFTMYLNEKRGYFKNVMHYCPSKGRLLKLRDEIGLEPYPDYCMHCDGYRQAIENVGLKYVFDFQGCENASCALLVYDPKTFDGRIIVDEDTVIMDRKSEDNEYYHPDFHSSMNMGINYLGTRYGVEAVEAYLKKYTVDVYGGCIRAVKQDGLRALEQHIRNTYEKEHAPEALTTECTDDRLTVRVEFCPAVRHLHKTGRVVSDWFVYTTKTVMQTIADECGLSFEMLHYDAESGAAEYSFRRIGEQA